MELQLLQEFVSLVETKSFQETAEQMNVSQSALTKHIHKLEEELSVSLFDRSTRSVELNEFSRAYYPYAKQIAELYTQSGAAIASILAQRENTLRVALTPAISHYNGVEILSGFARRYPQYQMEITERPHVLNLLAEQKCDFALAMENDDMDERMIRLLYKVDKLTVVFPASHPLASQKAVTIAQIARERFILHRNSSGELHLETRKFLRLCKQAGIQPQVAANIVSIPTILEMVSQEQGIAILHQDHVPANVEGVFCVDLDPPVRSCIYALYLEARRMPEACRAFRQYLENAINGGAD